MDLGVAFVQGCALLTMGWISTTLLKTRRKGQD